MHGVYPTVVCMFIYVCMCLFVCLCLHLWLHVYAWGVPRWSLPLPGTSTPKNSPERAKVVVFDATTFARVAAVPMPPGCSVLRLLWHPLRAGWAARRAFCAGLHSVCK